ncbi:MAG: hypothetical protein IK130_02365 [Oscillospiraceae bacterium]|nr:hypothetical protein [Oscillospiraceae bacterium]
MKKQFIKRTISAVCAAMMISGGAALLPASAAEQGAVKLMGDLNGDCKVTMEDAKKTLDIAVAGRIGLVDNKVNAENNPADIDMNGTIETMDALAILRYFCQTLVGDQPLWSDIRKLTYHDGTEFSPILVDETVEYEQLPFEKRGMYLEIGCAEGKPGEEVTVPVYLAGIETLVGFQYFQSAPARLTPTNITSDLGIAIFCYLDENGNPQTKELVDTDTSTDPLGVANTYSGAFVWTAPRGEDMTLTEGMVIANYSYKIPEDAKDGEVFVVSVNPAKTMFGTNTGDSMFNPYQYTTLDGAIVVKK